VLDKHKMAKHFANDITDTSFSFARKTDEVTVEAALDGLYVVRTSLPAAALDDPFVTHPAKLPHPDRRALLILFAAQHCRQRRGARCLSQRGSSARSIDGGIELPPEHLAPPAEFEADGLIAVN
jgi:hypothetical protein